MNQVDDTMMPYIHLQSSCEITSDKQLDWSCNILQLSLPHVDAGRETGIGYSIVGISDLRHDWRETDGLRIC